MGGVYWVTGLSGAGKTTLGRLLFERLKQDKRQAVYLDGDILREIFGNDLGYSQEDRRKSAMRNSRLCKALSDQGIDVTIATISMFHSCRDWNRANIPGYREIYIRVPWEVLRQRDQKGLYSGADKGEVAHVVGFDIPFEEPQNSDLIIDNDGSVSPEELADHIYQSVAILNYDKG